MKKTGKYDEDERDADDEDDEVGDENEADDGDGGWMRVKMKVIIRWRSKPCFIGKHTPVHLSDMSAETPYKCETLTSLKVVRYRGWSSHFISHICRCARKCHAVCSAKKKRGSTSLN